MCCNAAAGILEIEAMLTETHGYTLERPSVDALVERRLEILRQEFPDDGGLVEQLSRAHFEALRAHATIEDFLPTLVYRFTREELKAGDRAKRVPMEDE